jgi:acetyl-CoA acyltransferase
MVRRSSRWTWVASRAEVIARNSGPALINSSVGNSPLNSLERQMDVFIVGVGMTPLGKHLDKSVKQMTAQSIDAALTDAGVGKDAIEAAWFSNTRQGALEGQHGIRGQIALKAAGFESVPIFNTDSACASSSSGLMMGFAAIRAGIYKTVLVVGTEKINYPDRRK